MTNKEAIDTIDILIAQIEWDYPIQFSVALDMAKKSLKKEDEETEDNKSI